MTAYHGYHGDFHHSPNPDRSPSGQATQSHSDLSPATLLGRPLKKIPVAEGLESLTGATVLVTGAAGSVGSALVARLARSCIDRVIAVDHHEASLFRLGRDLGRRAPVELRLVDVRNTDKVRRILHETRPPFVFHLAAYKHVPFGESEPDEAISVNVFGTAGVARASAEARVRSFVYPSSDKSVNPPSLYGATKRIAEATIQSLADEQDAMNLHVVRYVNILGTSGSVIETFAKQVREGSPLTLTDDRMTRYWMAMEEGTSLLIHAVALPTGSCTLLDVGDPITVRAMATRVARIVRDDDSEPEIVITGSRPGERLAEELLSRSESVTRCDDDPVFRVVHSRRQECGARVEGILKELPALISQASAAKLRAQTMAFATELQ